MAANLSYIPAGATPFWPPDYGAYQGRRSGRAQTSPDNARARDEVIDVQVRRVDPEGASIARKSRADSLAPGSKAAAAEEPGDANSRRAADLESELLREPFRYEKAQGSGEIVLKLPPVRRGILIDSLA